MFGSKQARAPSLRAVTFKQNVRSFCLDCFALLFLSCSATLLYLAIIASPLLSLLACSVWFSLRLAGSALVLASSCVALLLQLAGA